MNAITRGDYDEHGGRWATCTRCGMGWVEHREPVELFPGEFTTAGERDHECPEPLPYEQALSMAQFYVSSGIPIHQRLKAQIRLGLAGRLDER